MAKTWIVFGTELARIARRIPSELSFAVLALTKGMPIESVSRILGHTNITTTQIYAKITMQKLNADMDDLEKQLQDLAVFFSEFCHLLRYII